MGTNNVDINKVHKLVAIAKNSKDEKLKNMVGKLMGSNQVSRSLANHIVHGK